MMICKKRKKKKWNIDSIFQTVFYDITTVLVALAVS